MTPEFWILLFEALLTVIGAAVGYGILIGLVKQLKAQVTELKEITTGLVQRVEVLERRSPHKTFAATSGG